MYMYFLFLKLSTILYALALNSFSKKIQRPVQMFTNANRENQQI